MQVSALNIEVKAFFTRVSVEFKVNSVLARNTIPTEYFDNHVIAFTRMKRFTVHKIAHDTRKLFGKFPTRLIKAARIVFRFRVRHLEPWIVSRFLQCCEAVATEKDAHTVTLLYLPVFRGSVKLEIKGV